MAARTKAPTGTAVTVPNEESFWDDSAMPQPYSVEFTIEGTRDYLFNRYDVPADPDELKGQNKVKTPGTMVHLDSEGHLAARTVALWNCVVAAGKYRQNPRSKRGSFATVLKEAIEMEGLDENHPDLLTFISPSGKPYGNWEYEFTARTKKAGAFAGYVTRVRPAIHAGWSLTGRCVVLLPEYVTIPQLHEAFSMGGRFGGIGDGRTGGLGFGRFLVRRFEEADVSI